MPVPTITVAEAQGTPELVTQAAREFHLREYELLKQQRRELVEHSRKLELVAVAAIAAFYAWYVGGTTPRSPREALWIPVLLALLGALRSWSVLRRLGEIAEYIRILEASLAAGVNGLVGWETHRHPPERASSVFVFSATAFWLTLCAATTVALFAL